MGEAPVIWWIRRDFRLAENPALTAAVESGVPVIPVFLFDEALEELKTAPAWRTGLGLEVLAGALEAAGSRLILRRGKALPTLRKLIEETGATSVHWNRLYDPTAIARDKEVKAGLKEDGVEARSHHAHVLFEPWTVETGTGGFYKVYSPFWRAVRDRDVAKPEKAPSTIAAPSGWPESDSLDDWKLGAGMRRGAEVVRPHLLLGETAARDRLHTFVEEKIGSYKADRNQLDLDATSGLSEPLTYGEIGPCTVWYAGAKAMSEGKSGAEHFLKELVWRDFAHHLIFHTPQITHANWREEWDSFPWTDDRRLKEIRDWERGVTGEPVIDAAMREMYVTGRMHNRARMLVASYLTKHLMVHWKIGLEWFEDCLVDWDPASNAMGWQWTAGSGPDAAPYFRIFNPETQAEKFDPDGAYRARWIAEGYDDPTDTALSYFDAIPESWGMSPDDPYPGEPIVDLSEGRKRALAAYEARGD
ncbi:deoxyribodipyrimidine photo-lyase [Rhodobacterales bacterium HKCCE3408]|nr:deoxyribodipyrimidine photo-lyase [Rhodobacterales bacterium HKCCE3408]